MLQDFASTRLSHTRAGGLEVKVISAHYEKIAQVNCSSCEDYESITVSKSKKWDPKWDEDDSCFYFEFIDKDDYKSLWQRIKKAVAWLRNKTGMVQNSVMVEFDQLKELYELLYVESKTFLDPQQYLLINEPVSPKIRKEYGNWKPNNKIPRCYDAYVFETEDFGFGFFGDEFPEVPADRIVSDRFSFDFKKEEYDWKPRRTTWRYIWTWLRWAYKGDIQHHEICLSKYQTIDLLKAMNWCIKSFRPRLDRFSPSYIQLEVMT